jgi:hypothetical protein
MYGDVAECSVSTCVLIYIHVCRLSAEAASTLSSQYVAIREDLRFDYYY